MTNPNENSAELMSAYLDAELDASEAEAFESFLAESPEAQSELEDLRKVVSLVSGLPEVDAPPDFVDKVSRKLRRRPGVAADGLLMSLISLPFQVLSILVILAVAAIYMMAQLEQAPGALEHDPEAAKQAEPDAADVPVEPTTP